MLGERLPWSGPGAQTALVGIVGLVVLASVLAPLGVGTAAAAPEGEPNDTRDNPTAIAAGERITGEVTGGDDEDWFAIEVAAGETVNATLTAGQGVNDFKLYPPGGGFVGDTDVSEGTESIGTTARTGGTYLVRVAAEGDDGAPYELRVETTSTDRFEPNEDRETPTPIGVGDEQQGTIPIGDVDWFAFDAQAGATINATLTAGEGENDFKLYPPGGGFVGDTDVSEGTESIGTTAQTSGTYLVRVTAAGNNGADYSLRVETTRTDDFEPNEDQESAVPLDLGTERSGVVSLSDTDWFEFDVTKGETVRATMQAGAGTNDFKLYPPGGGFVGDTDVSNGTAIIGTTARTSGTYYVRTQGEPRGGPYTISVETFTTDPFEPNEVREEATPLEPRVERSGTISIGDVDWFAIGAAQGEPLNVTMTVEGGTNDLKLYPPEGGGGFVGDTDVTNGTDSVGTVTEVSGTYYVRVAPEPGGGDYTLLVNGSAAREPAIETPGSDGDGAGDVGDGDAPIDENGGGLPWLLILLVAVIIVLLVVVYLRRRGNDGQQRQPPR